MEYENVDKNYKIVTYKVILNNQIMGHVDAKNCEVRRPQFFSIFNT